MFCLTLRLINGKPFTGLHLVFFSFLGCVPDKQKYFPDSEDHLDSEKKGLVEVSSVGYGH